MNKDKQKIVVLAGPTAVGKSALGIELAQLFKAEILNADSMQVYRGLDIGTAKPGPAERQVVPHHLLELVNPDEEFNAALYRQMAVPLIAAIGARGKVPLLVGGTGLYIKTLIGGLLACPPLDPDLRRSLQQECRERGSAALYERLKILDPQAADKIHPQDKIRIMRALEIIKLTGSRFSAQVKGHGFKDSPFQSLKICLHLDRDQLYRRINQRCLAMIDKGLLAETKALIAKGYSSELKPLKSIGYRHMIQYLHGNSLWDQVIQNFQADTRRYAKRQMTWFRADPEVVWFDSEQKEKILETIKKFLLL